MFLNEKKNQTNREKEIEKNKQNMLSARFQTSRWISKVSVETLGLLQVVGYDTETLMCHEAGIVHDRSYGGGVLLLTVWLSVRFPASQNLQSKCRYMIESVVIIAMLTRPRSLPPTPPTHTHNRHRQLFLSPYIRLQYKKIYTTSRYCYPR